VAFSPLGHGGAVLRDPVLTEIAAAHGVSVAQVCLKWNLQRGVTVIPHTLSTSELAENISLADSKGPLATFSLTAQDMERIASLDRGDRCLVLDWGKVDPGPLLSKRRPPPCPVERPLPVAPGVLRLWHTPTSRSSRCLWMIEELREAYARPRTNTATATTTTTSNASGERSASGDSLEINAGSSSGSATRVVIPPVELQLGAGAMFAMEKPDWYIEMNPNGKIPILESDDCPPLWDSAAICFTMLDRFDPDGLLAPDDRSFRAVLHQWAFYCSNTLDNLVSSLLIGFCFVFST
jgi:hypothetical protein